MSKPVNSHACECLMDHDWVFHEYVISNRTMKSIAEELDVSDEYVSKCVEKLGIIRRRGNTGCIQSDDVKKRKLETRMKTSGHEQLSDKDWLYNEYIVLKRNIKDIARDFSVNKCTVSRWLHKYDIPTRRTREGSTHSDEQKRKLHENYMKNRASKYFNKEWLEDQYYNNNKTIDCIAEEINIDSSTVWSWLVKLDIPRNKNPGAARRRWLNGVYDGKPRYSLGRAGWYIRKTEEKIWLRSTYETRVAAKLDALCIDWKYECKHFVIDDIGSTYTPDFYFPDVDMIWEIKGWLDDDSSRKMSEFFKRYPEENLKLIYLSDIEQLENLAENSDITDIITIGKDGI